MLKQIVSRLAAKWRKTYTHTCGYSKSRFAITMVQATHLFIRGFQVPVGRISIQMPQWEVGASLNLYQ